MKCALILVACVVGTSAQVVLGTWVASVPSASELFNSGLWRGAAAGAELGMLLSPSSPLFDIPVEATVAVEYRSAVPSTASVPDEYRGWIARACLTWAASRGTVTPYVRLGAGWAVGTQYMLVEPSGNNGHYQWKPSCSAVAFWSLGLRGVLTTAVQWVVEAECLAGDAPGVLLPIRFGMRYIIGGSKQ